MASLARTPQPSPGACRQRRLRDRQRTGVIRVAIETDEAALVDMLTRCGTLHPTMADDPGAIAEALRELIETLCALEA